LKYLAVLILIVVLFAGWQFSKPLVANYLLQDELHDLAAQAGTRIGLLRPNSDDDLRTLVVQKAASHDIALEPSQIVVRRGGTSEAPTSYLAADYTVDVRLAVFTSTLRFTPSSTAGKPWVP